jgi:hypothetical protein
MVPVPVVLLVTPGKAHLKSHGAVATIAGGKEGTTHDLDLEDPRFSECSLSERDFLCLVSSSEKQSTAQYRGAKIWRPGQPTGKSRTCHGATQIASVGEEPAKKRLISNPNLTIPGTCRL